MESELISKFSNIYIMLLYAIISNDINRVKHFLSDEMYEKYKSIIENNLQNKEIQMYDELNVKEIEIIDRVETTDYLEIKVKLISRYMDYVIDAETKKYKRGINDHRLEKVNYLTFKKSLKASSKELFTCPNCGANLDVNFTGTCPYCKSVVSMENNDYILTSLETS